MQHLARFDSVPCKALASSRYIALKPKPRDWFKRRQLSVRAVTRKREVIEHTAPEDQEHKKRCI